jgi:hypothetical protein
MSFLTRVSETFAVVLNLLQGLGSFGSITSLVVHPHHMTTVTTSNLVPSHLKKQIRDATRLLSRPNLPSDIRQVQERKLAHLNAMMRERGEEEKVRAMRSRYAKVRFFETTKAKRHLKQAARNFAQEPSEAHLNAWMEAKRNLVYVQEFPLDRKYISLFPSGSLTDEKVLAQRAQIRSELASKNGLFDKIELEDAMAMAKADLAAEGPKSVDETTAQAVDAANLKMNKALATGKGRSKGNDDDEDEDDDDDEEEEEDDDDDEEDGDNDDDGQSDDVSGDDDDDDDAGDDDEDDFDDDDDDEDGEEYDKSSGSEDDEDGDDDEDDDELESDEEDFDDSDEEDGGDDDDDDDDEDDADEESDEEPAKKARHQ